jgi:hypothetical protein
MAFVVVTGAVIQCSHGGQARLTAGNAKLKVDGQAAVTAGQEAGISFAPGSPGLVVPCPKLANAGTPPPPSPCAATLAATAGVSVKITVDGQGALLDNASGNATNTNDPGATWSVTSAGQTKLQEA